MNKLSRNNLQEFCRLCLTYIPKRRRVLRNSSGESKQDGYDLRLLPQLREIFVLVTSIDVPNENDKDVYPRSLCQSCYDKMMSLQDFHNLAVNTAETISKIINDGNGTDKVGRKSQQSRSVQNVKKEPSNDESALLMANLEPLVEIAIEADPQDNNKVGEPNSNIIPPQPKRICDNKKLKCPFCKHEALKQVFLDAHIRGVHDGHERPFLCAECQGLFKTYDRLRVHRIESKHSIEQTFICGINGCDASFKLMETLKDHREDKHTSSDLVDFEKMLEYKQWKLDDGDGERICQLCLMKCSTKYELFIHQRRHAEMKNYICKVCGIGKATRKELLTHMRTHPSEKVKCSLCPQEFNHKNAIYSHMQVIHGGLRPYACSCCSKCFPTRTALKRHERQVHTKERPYICNICNKGFIQTTKLKYHMLSHDTLRKHVCPICSMCFKVKTYLTDHKKRHQGDKPHVCNICGRGFVSEVDLATHKQSHTEEEKNRAEIECGRLDTSQENVPDSH